MSQRQLKPLSKDKLSPLRDPTTVAVSVLKKPKTNQSKKDLRSSAMQRTLERVPENNLYSPSTKDVLLVSAEERSKMISDRILSPLR